MFVVHRYSDTHSISRISPSFLNPTRAVLHALLLAYNLMGFHPPAAPWTWSCDAELARELQTALREAGVREQLCMMGEATACERLLFSKRWTSFCNEAMKDTSQLVAEEQEAENEIRRDTLAKTDDPQSVCFHCLDAITRRERAWCRRC